MLEFSHAVPAFGRILKLPSSSAVSIEERTGYAIATMFARKDMEKALATRVEQRFGVKLSEGPNRTIASGIFCLGIGPGKWLAMREGAGTEWAASLAEETAGLASITDQSDGLAVLRVSGPKARDVLAKGVPIDLHPKAFGPADVASTQVAYMGVTLWQVDNAPTFEVALFRSLAGSFAHWLIESAAEFTGTAPVT